MIPPHRSRLLRERARTLAEQLSRFKTPGSNDPVDPSRLGAVANAARRADNLDDVRKFVSLMPTSAMRKLSKSAGPQLDAVRKRVEPLLGEVKNAEELAYLLSWARRLLHGKEKGQET